MLPVHNWIFRVSEFAPPTVGSKCADSSHTQPNIIIQAISFPPQIHFTKRLNVEHHLASYCERKHQHALDYYFEIQKHINSFRQGTCQAGLSR